MMKRKFLSRSVLFMVLRVSIYVIYLVCLVDLGERMNEIKQANLPVYSLVFAVAALGAFFFVLASLVTTLKRLVSFVYKFAVSFVATQWVGLKTIMEGMKLG